ncbi:competence/damage-inducible protein A [Methylomonas sp. LL1]|uniref:competence/damage-inducible protein A n=1 Tax=Methylomonas sp. LL1 TaxID=2785785 RepID=UPI0018C390FC|nr:molybdopterin-binding protein [Methylomonas sp. LL1]QPK61857.1 competence/damage-inducible protein A [Methylomonas sp. LL1]
MKIIAEIFSQGDEVVSGQIVDSNAAWLSGQLTDLGFTVSRHTAVGDRLDDLVGLIAEIAVRADCCICSGGLGPTIDDLTAEAAAIAAGQPLTFDADAMERIEAYFAKRQRPMPAINRKQAYFPDQSVRIDNPGGTAPGFAMLIQRCWFVFLPGVPSEMKTMFGSVREQLPARFSLQPGKLVTLRSIGIGESAIQQSLDDLQLPEGVRLGFRAAVDEVQTKLLFPAGFDPIEMAACARQAQELIGDYVFGIDGLEGRAGGDLLAVTDRLVSAKNYRLAVLETASGGLLAAKCQGRDWLETAYIAKDMADAIQQLQIDAGDDPSAIAQTLATQLKQRQNTDLALVQLYVGSQDDYRRKDGRIVLYNCLQTGTGSYQSQQTLAGAAQTKQNQAALLSLDLLRRRLQNRCL